MRLSSRQKRPPTKKLLSPRLEPAVTGRPPQECLRQAGRSQLLPCLETRIHDSGIAICLSPRATAPGLPPSDFVAWDRACAPATLPARRAHYWEPMLWARTCGTWAGSGGLSSRDSMPRKARKCHEKVIAFISSLDIFGRSSALFVQRIGASIRCGLAGQLIAGNLQPGQIPEDCHRDGLGIEECVGQARKIFDGDGFDFRDQLVEIVEAVEIHFLPGQV
jgi:hypothetical protein